MNKYDISFASRRLPLVKHGVSSFSVSNMFRLFRAASCSSSEPVFLNVYGAQESVPRHLFRQPMYSLAGRYDNPIPARCLAPIDFLKIPALIQQQVFSSNQAFLAFSICSENILKLGVRIE